LLQNYEGIRIYDEEKEVAFKVIYTYEGWKKKDKTDKEIHCFCVLTKPVNVTDDDGNDVEFISIQSSFE